ncbi:T9SS type A sorting domain-containing protein [Algibacter miyuki]|uniref:T9SS type A sorting domain-containing protein n=1 Tax=Algibacter miyuki TaxID=1306933 RepID=A0ABV5H0H6_9FLAO|nr:T9SS type A sorting domain-containing protein [Algibacter miyuki]MDN3667366.1 T9SS type A sorting domain-containing protein [Algibacter miyuki]
MKAIKITLLLLSLITTAFGQNSLTIENLEAAPGENTKVIIALENSDNISGFQFKIKVPNGLILKEKEAVFTGRASNHVIYPKALGNGTYLLLGFSGTNTNFTGSSGGLIEIPIEIPLNYQAGETYNITLLDVIVSSSNGEDLGSNHQDGVLTIVEGENPDLEVDAISVLQADILPNAVSNISWNVENVGLAAAIGGWREQVALVSQTNGKKYIIGYAYYNNTLLEGASIDRSLEVNIPQIIGFDGDVKIEVSLVTNSGVKEPTSAKENNIAVSAETKTLLKRLIFTLDKKQIIESSDDLLRFTLKRSGNTEIAENFTISTTATGAFNLPATLTIAENASSNFLYVNPIDNASYEGDRDIEIQAIGSGYAEELVNLKLLDDEKVILTLSHPETYNTTVGSTIPFTLNASFSVNSDQVIDISTDKSGRLALPSTVTLLAGTQSVSFDASIKDTGAINKATAANVFAKADGYITAIKDIQLGSINIPNFTLDISPSQISEGDGIKASYFTLRRTDHLDKTATVKISASIANQLILPSEILYKVGESEKTFNIGAVNNSEVEGERTVTVTSQIKFDGCACVDANDINASVSSDITILDNDGLALSVKISPSTIKAGAVNNKLIVSRNTNNPTILQDPVEVTLSNDLAHIVELPSTVTIPAGEKSVELSFNTSIDPNQTGDESVRIQAEATDYTTGYGWILISNQNKPDASIIDITTIETPEAGQTITVHTFIQNQGNVSFPTNSKIDYYLSKTANIGILKPFVSTIINKAIAVDATYEHIEDVELPNFSGDYHLIAAINSDYSITELDYENNQNQIALSLSPAYAVQISLNKSVYNTNERVEVSGTAKTASGDNVPNAEIALKIENTEFKKDYTITTDASGNFVFEYLPFENENGSYNVTACFPGEAIAPQASFELLGFEIIGKPQFIKWETLANTSLGKELRLKNNTNTRLTGVMINIPEGSEFSIDQTPMDIEPGATIVFPFDVVSMDASAELKYTEFKLKIESNEGALYSERAYYYCKNQVSKLVANPISINTTMAKDETRLYEFTIKNVGAVNAENVELLLPDLDWLRLHSQPLIASIKPDEEIKIVLEFKPTVKEQVNVPITGNLVAKQTTGPWLSIPFKLETVSESTGKLIVDATDEYTYNTSSAPHLEGAKVVVKHPFTGAIIAEGFTDASGLFEIPDINEGWYVVNVTAEKHNPYQNNILVDPGKDTRVTAFLPYQAVTYSWDVQPIEILDEYDITLQVKFETNVPLPVIVMEIDNPKLDLNPGESRMTYITVTNHGLIAAQNVSISTGEADGYTIKPLITSLDVLNAKSAVTVPVLIKNIIGTERPSGLGKASATKAGGGSCNVPVTLRAVYICDTEKEMFAFTAYVNTCASTGGGGGPIIVDGCYSCGPGGVSGGGGGTGTGFGPGSGTSTLTSFPDFCDPCLNAVTSTVLSCNPYTSALSCAFSMLTSTGLVGFGKAAVGCVKGRIGCALAIIDLRHCFPSFGGGGSSGSLKTNASKASLAGSGGNFDFIFEDFEKISEAEVAQEDLLSEYFQNEDLESNNDYLALFLNTIGAVLDSEGVLTSEDILALKNDMAETSISEAYIDSFVNRWNTSVAAWNANVLSPNAQYPNIIDKTKIDNYNQIKADLVSHAFTRGFVSVADMYNSDLVAMDEFIKAKSEDEASVCATVTIEFPQRLTMTREAFEGTLNINNASAKSITEIHLDLVVKDENGENKTHLFQINKEEFLNGNGTVNSDESGQGLVIFIPTKEAAPEVAKSYSFGGILSYFDPEIGEKVSITLNPVTLEVNPSPDLILHYFMQRDILGDDALTEDVIEPSIPAELSLMIINDGFGLANDVNVESMQPKIVDNEKGLLINFEMIGSNFNNEPTQMGLLNVDFGDIQPKTAAVGQWYFTSSLIGHFVEYDVKVNHTSSFGNANLSLIKGAYIHELVRSVKAYGDNSDDISDFLVNDMSDVYDTPDMIYLSNGTSEAVSKAEAVSIVEAVTPGTLTAKIQINPITTGWNYGNILDESAANYKLEKVIRDRDNFEIPSQNFWQTHVTLKDGLNPKYENKLHVLDKITAVETYTLYFTPIDGDIPKIVEFIDAPAEYNTVPVELVTVEFNKEIDFNTFTTDNIVLIHQGVEVPVENILIGKINPTTFSINIEDVTAQSGYYELTVQALGIKDLVGNEGKDGKKIGWLQFINELGILKFESDQLKKNPVNSIDVIFNKPIRTEEFTEDKITINDAAVNGLTIDKIDDYNYSISGINPLNEDNGEYTMAIDVTNIKATDGISGLALQTFTWEVDNNLPKVESIQRVSQGAIDSQIITALEIELSRPIVSDIEASAFHFTKNGQDISIPITIQKIDDLHYSVLGLGGDTSSNGTYRVTIDQTSFRDENDNLGEGIAETSWTVRLDAIVAISNLKLTPDRGISDTDNITSGNDVQLFYTTLLDNVTVEVYELLATSEKLIDTQFRAETGTHGISLTSYTGAKKFKVVATDAEGRRSNAEILTAYLDYTDIIIDIELVDELSNDCSDFDYINVKFSEDIDENTFDSDAFNLKVTGISIPKNNVTIEKVTDKYYILNGIESPIDGNVVLEIDKTKIAKKLSGLSGFSTESAILGSAENYVVSISGEENPVLLDTYEYTADANMSKYEWIIINGEILSTDNNKVSVKWNKLGAQSLILRYQTPLGCTLTETIDVMVDYISLGVDDDEVVADKNFISPVPNQGKFSIHTNFILSDCTLAIFDVTGKQIYQENDINTMRKVKEVDVNLSSGSYFLILSNSEEKLHFKFVIH